jgi:hypothetical protein
VHGRGRGAHEREQSLYQDHRDLSRLRLADRKVHQTPAGSVGPLARGFKFQVGDIMITNATDFKLTGWVVTVGFYGEQSTALAGVPV